ncbi:tyrosine-type recombinase/integrase [Paenibacillus macerans]|uniref:tyrosine-type recombinase/integrase n=1 Tax=Paenibacillus macerans TaxID=44252 RepID=UPI002DBE4CF5|nr:tyrosine-type recombinase/integrase [Paenibacillus macerans]MEC0328762.1 tyrosine-type recombinase/integrase [Paenibacillus macerans]
MARRITKIPDEMPEQFRGWAEALGGFLTWKRAQGISDQTYEDYNKHVRLFFKRFPDAWTSVKELKASLFKHLAEEEIMPATFNNRLVYLRTFLSWCVKEGYLSENPVANIKKRKDEGRVVNIDAEILQRLIELPDQKTFTGLRDYALILLTLDTGIRPKESFGLLPVDFNSKAYEIYVVAKVAKTRVSRTLPISEFTTQAIKRLLAVRPEEWGPDVPIFCTWEGGPMNRFTWGDRIEMYSKKLGVHIRPYDLRHAFAIEYLRGGASAFALQRTLGHADMKMTQRYVALLDDDLKADHTKASPLNRLIVQKKRITKL